MDDYKNIFMVLMITVFSSVGAVADVSTQSESYWSESGKNERKGIGIALAGGGTKAASFSMGVLSALAKENQMWDVGAISTVSGGSYAGLFLYSRLIADKQQGVLSPEHTKRYFQDCIPLTYSRYGSPRPPFNNTV